MNCRKLRTIVIAVASLAGMAAGAQKTFSPADEVNPFIGTGGHGHTYPGASLPFGMVQLSPDTRLDGWDGCSAYHASDSVIYGFSHTHLSGTGCSDYGDILLMPVEGEVSLINYGYSSPFVTVNQEASPGYYKVRLDRYGIGAELTATLRTGFQRYTFSREGNGGIVIDLVHRDKVLESGLKVVSDAEIEGYRISGNWARRQIVYFVARFSKPFTSLSVQEGDGMNSEKKEFSGNEIRALLGFPVKAGDKILVKVGISATGTDGARANLEAENPGWDFDAVTSAASVAWNRELGKIRITGGTRDRRTSFYSALYHSMLTPNLYMDVDGKYRGRDLEIHTANGFDYYTVFSLWDTYRAAHPLYTLLDTKRTSDFINTFIRQYEEGGLLPVWELSANETFCMIGYHAVPVIADAYMKGIRGYDAEKAFEAMKHSAEQDHLGLKYYRQMGYIPADKEGESVSKTLEYAYDDWCIARMAKEMNNEPDYKTYIRRAQFYKNLYDPSTGFMRAKKNATWFTPFDPYEVNFNYTEANAWQYSFYVPQDIDGLASLMGGKDKLARKLDDLFSANVKTTGRDQADISGLIGQYAHGNEPSHHMAYLYSYAGEPWKTQDLVHRICRDFYQDRPDGLIGNEDCGQMSAWLVLSAMGFYPVTPVSNLYVIGTPMFPEAALQLDNGKSFSIKAKNLSDKNFYIQSAKLNGIDHPACFLTHEEIMNGGELIFTMGAEPNKKWGTGNGNIPVSAIRDYLITPVPSVERGSQTFMDTTTVVLSCPDPAATIHFTLDGSEPTMQSPVCNMSLPLSSTTTIKAFCTAEGREPSFLAEARFTKIPKNRKITIAYPYAPQYSAGGDVALINFIRGGDDFKTGNWQGYEGVDLEAVVDLGEVQKISRLKTGFLQDVGAWIFFPVEIEYFISTDGKTYKSAGISVPETSEKDMEVMVKDFGVSPDPVDARYVKVVAKNRKTCPSWHPGAGSKAWIFADEIVIE